MSVLALDIGARRIGCAVNSVGQLVLELPTIEYDDSDMALERIQSLLDEYRVRVLVLGRIRDPQSAASWRSHLQQLPSDIQRVELDETLTTKEAERQLSDEGHPGDSDARAARLILEQYLHDHEA